jgi:hypothetical protein
MDSIRPLCFILRQVFNHPQPAEAVIVVAGQGLSNAVTMPLVENNSPLIVGPDLQAESGAAPADGGVFASFQ